MESIQMGWRDVTTTCCMVLVAFLAVSTVGISVASAEPDHGTYYKEFTMPGVTPKVHDSYICSPKKLDVASNGKPKDEWILRYDPMASANRAHHMLLYACQGIDKNVVGKTHWECNHHDVCEGGRVIYAWAKNAPAMELPKDVGFEIGADTGISYLVLQIHYAQALPGIQDHSGLKMLISTQKQRYHAGIYVLVASQLDIPPNTPKIHADMNCRMKNDLHIFAYRVHAHKLGVVISGYQVDHTTQQLTQIAKGNPHWPQAFYPMDHVRIVHKDDILHGRCTYNSTGRNRHTYIGATAADEMCNLYLMYYTELDPKNIEEACWMESFPSITQRLPADSDQPLPRNPLLEMATMGENKNKNKTVSYEKTFHQSQHSEHVFKPTRVLLEPSRELPDKPYKKSLKMPGVTPKEADDYVCMAVPITEEEWILRFDPLASANRAHHMLLYGCSGVSPQHLQAGHWDCRHHGVCSGGQIMYAWAKNAPSTDLPKDVGFLLGGKSNIRYLVLQIHYANPLPDSIKDHSGLQMLVTKKPQKYKAGIYLIASAGLDIPPKTLKTHADMNCLVGDSEPDDIHLFAYRVHAHKLGTVISGYQLKQRTHEMVEIAKGNPQWPQAFYPMDKVYTVKPTDILVGRCTFNSINRTRHTYIGATAKDEMCNLYLMYYTDRLKGSSTGGCVTQSFDLTGVIPEDSDVPLPPNPLLEEMTHGENVNKNKEISYNGLFNPNKPIELEKKTHIKKQRPEDNFAQNQKPQGQYQDYRQSSEATSRGYQKPKQVEHLPQKLQTITKQGKSLTSQYHLMANWGPGKYALGQISAVSLDSREDVVIFHRGETVWDGGSFIGNKLRDTTRPIPQATLLHLQKDTGHVMHEWGANFFYMPHGLTIDAEDNIWVTDVGMHQVFKFPSGFGEGKPLLTLGKRFEPGSDDEHFCKPTGVSVMKNGEFFVSDGYCNSRILHYSAQGKLIKQLNTNQNSRLPYGQFQIPHALTLAEDKGEICVADRENGRVLCFFTANFELSRKFKFTEWGDRLFSVVYTESQGGKIFAVNGPEMLRTREKILVFQVDFMSGKLEAAFSPHNQGLSNPHDIACSKSGSDIYVVEIGPNRIWKFGSGSSKNNSEANQGKLNVEIKTGELQEGLTNKLNLFSGDWSSVSVSSLVLALLAIPVIVLAIVGIAIRCRKRNQRYRYMENGKIGSDMNGKPKSGLTLGSLLNKHHGFERIPNREIDCEDDLDSQDSDVEEFSATKV